MCSCGCLQSTFIRRQEHATATIQHDATLYVNELNNIVCQWAVHVLQSTRPHKLMAACRHPGPQAAVRGLLIKHSPACPVPSPSVSACILSQTGKLLTCGCFGHSQLHRAHLKPLVPWWLGSKVRCATCSQGCLHLGGAEGLRCPPELHPPAQLSPLWPTGNSIAPAAK